MAHAGGGARFGPDADSDTDAGGPDVHFPAADLDPSVPCRNPLDPAPYPEHERDAMDDVCFPSLFVAVNEGNGGLAEAELKHSWSRLQALIRTCLETDSMPADTVNMVHQFYEENVRASFTDAPEWSRKSIYQYVYKDTERQAAEAIQGVNYTMEFLRSQLATRREDGTVKLNSENVKLYLAAAKVHSSLVDAKRKREQR